MDIFKTLRINFTAPNIFNTAFVCLLAPHVSRWTKVVLLILTTVIAIIYIVYIIVYFYRRPSILWEVGEWKKENKIKVFIKKYKFVGREEEKRNLKAFLQNDKVIGLMLGNGGVGKTRLCIEFAEETLRKSKRKVFFINESKLSNKTSEKQIEYIKNRECLLVLDDPKDVDQVLDFLKDLYSTIEAKTKKDIKTKFLLVLRPALGNAIETKLKGDGLLPYPTIFKIEQGDFREFIEENFKKLESVKENITYIIDKARSNFDSLIALCEFYGENSELVDLFEVFDHKISKYVDEVYQIIGNYLNINQIQQFFYLLALIRPIKLKEEKKHLEKSELIWDLLKHLPTLKNSKVDILSYGESEGYSFISDTHAEFLLYKFIEGDREEFTNTWKSLLPLKPLNISLNIFNTRPFKENVELGNVQILREIWEELNSIVGENAEYFQSILFYSGDLNLLKFDCNSINVDNWKKTLEKIKKQKKENRNLLASGLFNATNHYGEGERLDEMEEVLKELRELAEKHPTDRILEELARGLSNATYYYGEGERLDEMEEVLKELRELAEKHPTDKILEELARGLSNTTKYYGIYKQLDKMEEALKELRELAKDHPTEQFIEELAKGLSNATNCYGIYKQLDKMEEALKELRELAKDHPTEKNLEILAKGLGNATNYYDKHKQLDKMEEVLKELQKLAKDYPTEKILEILIKVLSNATNYYCKHKQLDKMEEALKELQKQSEDHPTEKNLEELARGLGKIIYCCGIYKQWDKMEEALKELRKLAKDHPTENILEKLILGLGDATNSYDIHEEIHNHLSLLIEFYNNHFHLKENLRKEAEQVIYTIVSEIVKEKYKNSRNVGLEEVIKELKTQVREETDFMILLSNIEKYLSPELIEKIDQILSSLEKKK